MLKKLAQMVIRFIKKAAAGSLAWVVSLFVILIIGTIFKIPDHSSTISTLFSLIAVFIPIIIGIFVFRTVCNPPSANSQDITVYTASELQTFLDSNDIVDDICTKVVGVTFDNDDGTSRQDILSRCNVGDQVYFRYFIYHGKPAYSVITDHGQIGNLSAELSQTIDQLYDGCTVYGTITKISGGEEGFYYGCNLEILVFREKQDPATSKTESKTYTEATLNAPAAVPKQKIIYPASNKRKKSNPPDVDNSFIAEAQWYAARSCAEPNEDK